MTTSIYLMQTDKVEQQIFNIEVVIAEGFPLLSLSLVTEPLRVANRESRAPVFRWRVLSPDGRPVRSSSGLLISVDSELDDMPADAVILLASYHPERMVSTRLVAWLRRRAAKGAMMGCVDTGAMIFAQAGLLGHRPAAVHHEAIVGFRDAYGNAFFADKLFDLSQYRCSSAGGVVTIDMSLALIEHFVSRQLARRIAEVLNYRPVEPDRAHGAYGRDWSIPRLNQYLARSVEMMLANLDKPIQIATLAQRLNLPQWKLRRLFHRYLGMAPAGYYLELRLDRARNLLRNSHERVGMIAVLSGFENIESFSRAYKKRFSISPSADRQL